MCDRTWRGLAENTPRRGKVSSLRTRRPSATHDSSKLSFCRVPLWYRSGTPFCRVWFIFPDAERSSGPGQNMGFLMAMISSILSIWARARFPLQALVRRTLGSVPLSTVSVEDHRNICCRQDQVQLSCPTLASHSSVGCRASKLVVCRPRPATCETGEVWPRWTLAKPTDWRR